MIEQEIILLGLLNENPKHGYEIKKQIKKILSLFAGIDFKSIYYPLKLLEEKGLIIKHIDKQGKRPERFVYELTSKGKARFNKLLSESFLNFRRPQFSLDLCLYFLNNIKPETAKRRLRARMLILEKLSLKLSQMAVSLKDKESSPLGRILEHNLRMVQAEANFLSSLIETL
ncbi:MAG: PadR family transcriptional regulator [Candidatus Omnitrophota bacterium]